MFPLPYSTDVLYHLGAAPPAPAARVYGVELEMTPRGGVRQSQLLEAIRGNTGPWWIAKSDGSVPNGIEVVSLPLTLDQHRDGRWTDLLRPLLPIAKSGANTNACGIHVHCNLSSVSALTLGKILVFMNSGAHASFIEGIAQRSANSYARAAFKRLTDGPREKDYGNTGSRYSFVNVTRRTFEFRIFRGNMRAERIIKNVEFCDALTAWCERTSMAQIGPDAGDPAPGAVDAFRSYVLANRSRWPALATFITDHNI